MKKKPERSNNIRGTIDFDDTGKKIDLTALYQELISLWEKEEADRLLEIARKDYPDVRCLDDVIEKTKGPEIQQIPFLIIHIRAGLPKHLLSRTKREFTPKDPQDFVTPAILSYDAALRVHGGLKWAQIKFLHQSTVEAVVVLNFYEKVLETKIAKEKYGSKIMALVRSNSPQALEELQSMLKSYKGLAKNKGIEGFLLAKWEAEPHPRDEWPKRLPDDISGLMDETIMNKSTRLCEDTPGLTDFLPEELPSDVREKWEQILASCEDESKIAKLERDAAAGAFRTLPHEFVMDIKNENEKLNAQKRSAIEEIPYDDLFEKEKDGEKSYSLEDKLKAASISLADEIENRERREKVEKKLEEPRHRHLKPVYEKIKEEPLAFQTEIAEKLGISRNTVAKHVREIKRLFKSDEIEG